MVDADPPPLRLLLGQMPPERARTIYQDRLAEWAVWEEVSEKAQGHPAS